MATGSDLPSQSNDMASENSFDVNLGANSKFSNVACGDVDKRYDSDNQSVKSTPSSSANGKAQTTKRKKKKFSSMDSDGFRLPNKVAKVPNLMDQSKIQLSNLYSDLDSDSDLDADTAYASTTSKPKKVKIPPLILRDVEDWTSLSKELKNNCNDKFTAKLSGETIRLSLSTIDDFRNISKLLTNSGIQYFTYQLKKDKNITVVVRGLHSKVRTEDLAEDLLSQGVPIAKPTDVKQIRNHKTGIAYPLYLVRVPRNESGKQIWQITHVLNMVVTIESPKKRSGPIQCYKCQRWDHGQKCCYNAPRCMKCAGNHLSYQCTKKKDDGPPKCCNCQANHTANYRGCKLCPNNRQSVQPGKSFANAAAISESCPVSTKQNISNIDSIKEFPSLPSAQPTEIVPTQLMTSAASTSGNANSNNELSDIVSIFNMLNKFNLLDIISKIKNYLEQFLAASSWQEKLTIATEAYKVISDHFNEVKP